MFSEISFFFTFSFSLLGGDSGRFGESKDAYEIHTCVCNPFLGLLLFYFLRSLNVIHTMFTFLNACLHLVIQKLFILLLEQINSFYSLEKACVKNGKTNTICQFAISCIYTMYLFTITFEKNSHPILCGFSNPKNSPNCWDYVIKYRK